MEVSRTKNAKRNIIFGLINKIIVLLGPFIIRTVIIHTLGSMYLGLNSLFTSILQILNLTESGFNSAIIFALYKPIAENDVNKINKLMNYYRKVYRIIGVIILCIGFSITPFITKLISGTYPNDINIYIVFLISLINTSLTYFLFAYKNAILYADQRNDISSNIQSITYLFQYIMQIIILVVLKNYYLFLIVNTISIIINNISISIIVNKKYKNLHCEGNIDDSSRKVIRKKVAGLFIYKVCTVTRNSLDSIFISLFLGLNVVAIYSNYYAIITALIGLTGIIYTAIVAGVGNSIVVETVEKNYNDMIRFNFIFMMLSGWIFTCMLCLYQPFMQIWVGTQYLTSMLNVLLFCLYFYSLQIGVIRSAYSDAAGLWWESRYRAIVEAFVNVILNYILGKLFGLSGIILTTIISIIVINFGYGTQIVFKYYFKGISSKEFYIKHFTYFLITVIIAGITYFICTFIDINDIMNLILRGIVCVFVPTTLYILVYKKQIKEYNVLSLIKKK